MALDPVCGMTVDPARAAGHLDHDGTTYYFCSKGCVAKFGADPKKYLSGTREAMPPARPTLIAIGGLTQKPKPPSEATPPAAISNPKSTEWICPMDPEVLSDKPGAFDRLAEAQSQRDAEYIAKMNATHGAG